MPGRPDRLDSTELRPRSLLVVADFDSRIIWAQGVAEYFAAAGFCVTARLPAQAKRLPFKRNEDWIYEFHDDSSHAELIKDALRFDVVLVALGGGANLKTINAIREACAKERPRARPVIITGFNGLVDETDIHGLLCRVGSDIICINSPRNLRGFQSTLEQLSLPTSALYLTGFIRPDLGRSSGVERRRTIERVVYADQSGTMSSKKQAQYVAEHLIAYARRFPARQLIIKIRPSWSVTQGHVESFPILQALRQVSGPLPSNLSFDAGDPAAALEKADLLLSFSSTMLIEAMIAGIRCAAISDLGITKRLGNHVFVGSDLLCPFSAILNDDIPVPNPLWLKDNVEFSPRRITEMVAHAKALLDQQASTGDALPLQPPGYSIEKSPYMYRFTQAPKAKPKPWRLLRLLSQ